MIPFKVCKTISDSAKKDRNTSLLQLTTTTTKKTKQQKTKKQKNKKKKRSCNPL